MQINNFPTRFIKNMNANFPLFFGLVINLLENDTFDSGCARTKIPLEFFNFGHTLRLTSLLEILDTLSDTCQFGQFGNFWTRFAFFCHISHKPWKQIVPPATRIASLLRIQNTLVTLVSEGNHFCFPSNSIFELRSEIKSANQSMYVPPHQLFL